MESLRKLIQICGETNGANASVANVRLNNTSDVSHYHPEVKEIYYFTEGKGYINLNGEEIEIKKGDCIIISHNNTHFVHTNTSISFTCICIPPWNEKCEVVTKEAKGTKKQLDFCDLGKVFSENNVDISLLNGKYSNETNDGRAHIYCFIDSGYITINGKQHFVRCGDCYAIPTGSDESIKTNAKFLLVETKIKDKVPLKTNINNEIGLDEIY